MAARYDSDEEADDLEDYEDPDPLDQESDATTETVECPYCGEEVYQGADICPHCRSFVSLNELPPKRRPWFKIGVVLAALALLIWIFL